MAVIEFLLDNAKMKFDIFSLMGETYAKTVIRIVSVNPASFKVSLD